MHASACVCAGSNVFNDAINLRREKVNNAVLFEKQVYEKLLVEVPKYKMITPSILSDRMRIGGSLARAAIQELAAKGLIRPLVKHAKQLIYTRATGA